MNNVVLIWEEIPERTLIYYFTNLNQETYNKIVEAHNCFINVDNVNEERKAIWVSNWLGEMVEEILQYQKKESFQVKDATIVICGVVM